MVQLAMANPAGIRLSVAGHNSGYDLPHVAELPGLANGMPKATSYGPHVTYIAPREGLLAFAVDVAFLGHVITHRGALVGHITNGVPGLNSPIAQTVLPAATDELSAPHSKTYVMFHVSPGVLFGPPDIDLGQGWSIRLIDFGFYLAFGIGGKIHKTSGETPVTDVCAAYMLGLEATAQLLQVTTPTRFIFGLGTARMSLLVHGHFDSESDALYDGTMVGIGMEWGTIGVAW